MITKKLAALTVATILSVSSTPVSAATKAVPNSNAFPVNEVMPNMLGTSQEKVLDIDNGNLGTLTSNVWRSHGDGDKSGNTLQWDYQVSAYYDGPYTLDTIRTTWYSSADLKNSGSISMGVSGDGASAGGASSWQSCKTIAKYWENTKGQTNSSWKSNIVIGPAKDYRSNTIYTVNTAKVVFKDISRKAEITAGV